VLAGANGVGKTTFAHANLRPFVDQRAFLNAQTISPREIARQDDSGTRIVDPAGWSLLQERIAAASAT